MPNITGLTTTAAVNAVENKIYNVGNLVKKAEYDSKYRTLKRNILLFLVVINLRMIYLIQR